MDKGEKTMEMKITQATSVDIPAILTMYQRRVAFNNEHGIPQWTFDEVTWEAFAKTYTIEDYYVGKLGEDVVCGMFIVDVDNLYWPEIPQGKYLYLHKICVDPAYSKRGYSDAMIEYFKAKGKREGHAEVRLDVREKKDKLRAMYERHDFQLVRTGSFVPEFTTALYQYKFSWDEK